MKRILAFFIIMSWLIPVIAQTDSLTLYNKFFQISSAYQEAPVNVSFRIERSTNVILSKDDTASVDGFIYMPDTNTIYMKVLPIEQLIADSVGVLVQHEQQRIYKVTDKEKLKKQLSAYVGNRLKDSTIDDLKSHYSISESLQDDNPVLVLLLRGMLPGTSLPAIEIRLAYETESVNQLWIEHTARRLLPINESDTSGFVNQYGRSSLYQIQTNQGNLWYILREEKTKIIYTHRNTEVIPDISVDSYIHKNAEGIWTAADRFINYRVIEY